MTDAEIGEMRAGRELDKIVAQHVFGQTDFNHLTFCYVEGVTEDGTDGWDGFVCPRCNDTSGPCCRHYSTSISDAWRVVEHLNADCGIDMFIESWSDGEWFVASHPVAYSSREPVARCDGKKTGKPSLPLAICRWALKKALIGEA